MAEVGELSLSLQRAGIVVELAEVMARYTRAVDQLAYDRLADIFLEDARVRYAWLPNGASTYESETLGGIEAIQSWLKSRLGGRTELRRYLSGLELHAWSAAAAVATIQMHERDMRITGSYRLEAVRARGGWRIRRLDLTEEIHRDSRR